MLGWRYSTDTGDAGDVQDEQHLRALLREFQYPRDAFHLRSPANDELMVLVHGPNAVVEHTVVNPWRCRVASTGDSAGGTVALAYAGHTEVPERHLLPAATMTRIVTEFFTTGCLPPWISWEEM